MTSRERLMAILNREKKVDRVAWSPLIDGYYMSSLPEEKDIIDAFKEINADVMERHVFTWTSTFINAGELLAHKKVRDDSESNSQIEFTENGVKIKEELKEVGSRKILTIQYEINGHVLTQKSAYTKESPYIPFPIEYPIKTVEDIEAYIFIKKRERYAERFSNFIKEDKRIGELGIATDTAPASPVQEVIQILVGIEKFYMFFLPDHLKKINELMEVMHEKNLEAYKLIAKSPSTVVIDYENTSTTLTSPEIYEKYSLNQINDYADIMHKSDKIFLTHRCGTLKNLINLLKKGRDDGITDITPYPTGDLNIWDTWEALPDKIVIGGLDPIFLTQWPASKVKDYVNLILSKIPINERLIIGTADALPKDAKLENLIAVGEAINNGGSKK